MREVWTSLLDVLGALLVAAAVAGGLFPALGWWSVGLAGVVLMAASQVADTVQRRGGGTP